MLICLVMVGQLKGMGTGFLNHGVKKSDGPRAKPIPLYSKLLAVSIIIQSIGVVINDCHHLRGGRVGLYQEVHNI